jgi:DNA modification methylase
MDFVNKIICGDWIRVLKGLPSNTFHCCITSPPYWGQRNYGVDGQLGLEKTPEEHIEKLVEGFSEVCRVLRPDGVLWLNYGDKYGTSSGAGSRENYKQSTNRGSGYYWQNGRKGISEKNLLMLPARVALALQADGWILRSDVIWAKALSFCDEYSGSTMPESVNGWRWERHRVKVKGGNRGKEAQRIGSMPERPQQDHNGRDFQSSSEWQDCPGCEKCEKNGGLILRCGSWRCTKGHEYIFQLVKSGNYFCDMEAVREKISEETRRAITFRNDCYTENKQHNNSKKQERDFKAIDGEPSYSGRNLRDVWVINPQAYPDAHYATFPEALVEPCIKVSTSQKGVCPKCGAPWARIIESDYIKHRPSGGKKTRIERGNRVHDGGSGNWGTFGTNLRRNDTTLGWKATCSCGIEKTQPALVLDPFMGSGTVGMVSAKLGRNYTGIEINPEYIENQAKYRLAEGETGIPKKELMAGQKVLFE